GLVTLRPRVLHRFGELDEVAVLRLHRQGEAAVVLGVFVTAIDPGLVRQRAQLAERSPHLLRGPLEGPAAADREQGVAAEYRLAVREIERDVPASVAGDEQDVGVMAGEREAAGFVHRLIDAGDAIAIV